MKMNTIFLGTDSIMIFYFQTLFYNLLVFEYSLVHIFWQGLNMFFTSGWGKSQTLLFTPEKLDMFDPIYCFQQVFWLNIRPSAKRYIKFLYFL